MNQSAGAVTYLKDNSINQKLISSITAVPKYTNDSYIGGNKGGYGSSFPSLNFHHE